MTKSKHFMFAGMVTPITRLLPGQTVWSEPLRVRKLRDRYSEEA